MTTTTDQLTKLTKRAAIDALTNYGHVFAGAGPIKDLPDFAQRVADRGPLTLITASLRHCVRQVGQTLHFPSLNPDSKELSRLDLDKGDTCHRLGQYLIIHTAYNYCGEPKHSATTYWLPFWP